MFPIFLYNSNLDISNYWYLKVNFLGQKIYFEISLVWDEFQQWDIKSWLYIIVTPHQRLLQEAILMRSHNICIKENEVEVSLNYHWSQHYLQLWNIESH